MTAIDDVIQPGEDIPDDVTEVEDRTEQDHERGPDGRWHMGGVNAGDPNPWDSDELMDFAPLTVTAVREQPAEPEDVHYYFTELRTGLTYCGVDALEEDGVSTTSESGKATCTACLAAAGEDPPGARDADGFLRLKGTATGDNQLDPEPVGRTDPDTPVLVFRSASGRTEVARRAEGFSVHVLHGSDRLTTDEARRLGAKLARYPDATPEPQQPVQARDINGHPMWQHPCGWSIGRLQRPNPASHEGCHPGPWLPLLVGGDPAPEQPSAPDFLAAINTLTIQRDGARADAASYAARLKATDISWTAVARERDEAASARDAAIEALIKTRADREAALRQRDELAELIRTPMPAQPDPLVLSLPEVPRKDIALVAAKGQRFVPVGGASWQAEVEHGRCCGLGELLDLAGPLTVELAPPPEPRTWPKIDAAPVLDDPPETVEVNRWRWHLVDQSGGRYYQPGQLGERTIQQLRELGDVTEVTE